MINEFNNLAWHDANLLEIVIPRQHEDIVRVLIEWPENEMTALSWIEFFDCYGFKADMHFGHVPPEPILKAYCVNQSNELGDLRSKWGAVGLNLNDLFQFEIQTNTSNSILKIFAQGFRMLDGE